MTTEGKPVWEGRSTVELDHWISAELEKAPEPTQEQRGNLTALFNGAPTESAA
ncbi:hypothetical protein [Streptomyces sp. XH2]|uniref:hypothetical protein n=1 Tax=Streptomyces sp. XH2 TaxID=3412483 RepID=UPI003C7EADBB